MRRKQNWMQALSLLLLIQITHASISQVESFQQNGIEVQLWSKVFGEIVKKKTGELQLLNESSLKKTTVDFWNKDFRLYHMHSNVRKCIGMIDEQEMSEFLISTGVKIDPDNASDIITPKNITAYLRYKKLGTAATYAWIDLLKAHPTFIQAVQDWQTIQQEYGFEFIPTYYLLVNAKLETKKDAEAWADIFTATFSSIPKKDIDKRELLLFCLTPRIGGDLKVAEPPMIERFAFLKNELEKQTDANTSYTQVLVFSLYNVHFHSDQFAQAADFARFLEPKKVGLHLCFISQALGQDSPSASETLSKIESLQWADKEEIRIYREMIERLKQMKKTEPAI